MLNTKITLSGIISMVTLAAVMVGYATGYGGLHKDVETNNAEIDKLREEVVFDTRDRINRTQHDADINKILNRIERNEALILNAHGAEN